MFSSVPVSKTTGKGALSPIVNNASGRLAEIYNGTTWLVNAQITGSRDALRGDQRCDQKNETRHEASLMLVRQIEAESELQL